ncbi:MAG: helix-turn-helix domain-containing protein, partial [Chitinophagaceae bacterium]
DEEARQLLISYSFPGNVRELKNLAEQISVLSTERMINAATLRQFLSEKNSTRLPAIHNNQGGYQGEFANEREILYKLFFDMKKDVTELKKMFLEILQNPSLAGTAAHFTKESLMSDFAGNQHAITEVQPYLGNVNNLPTNQNQPNNAFIAGNNHTSPVILRDEDIQQHEEVEESLNIMDKEKELIIKALKKHRGKRKDAAIDLGISERTLYRKLKEYDIEDL